jgi:hypothetical protein
MVGTLAVLHARERQVLVGSYERVWRMQGWSHQGVRGREALDRHAIPAWQMIELFQCTPLFCHNH